jgi:uncharacterized protein involved in exopolysaccharide biosynthesis
MNPNDVAAMVMALVLFISVAAVLIFRGPIGKAIARRIEGNAGNATELPGRVAELEQRLAHMEEDRGRMAELEERLDFAERLLASAKEAARELPR